jgi:hypothetical protein
LRYHGAFTPSAWLTSYQLAGDNHLEHSEIGDGYGGKSRRVGACEPSVNGLDHSP